MFKKLKENLIESGYEIILIPHFRKYGHQIPGYLCPDTLQIFIDYSSPLEERVNTLIHELLHDFYPNWSEQRITNKEEEIYQNLGKRELGFLEFLVS